MTTSSYDAMSDSQVQTTALSMVERLEAPAETRAQLDTALRGYVSFLENSPQAPSSDIGEDVMTSLGSWHDALFNDIDRDYRDTIRPVFDALLTRVGRDWAGAGWTPAWSRD